MNKEPKEESINIFEDIFIDFIVGSIFISLLSATLLLIYNFILVSLAKDSIPINTYIIQQLNSLNMSSLTNNLNLEIQVLKSYTPIPIDQFIEDELTLIVPPAIILGLIY
jgi:hypothetical protein